jgi:hypothetical protein
MEAGVVRVTHSLFSESFYEEVDGKRGVLVMGVKGEVG